MPRTCSCMGENVDFFFLCLDDIASSISACMSICPFSVEELRPRKKLSRTKSFSTASFVVENTRTIHRVRTQCGRAMRPAPFSTSATMQDDFPSMQSDTDCVTVMSDVLSVSSGEMSDGGKGHADSVRTCSLCYCKVDPLDYIKSGCQTESVSSVQPDIRAAGNDVFVGGMRRAARGLCRTLGQPQQMDDVDQTSHHRTIVPGVMPLMTPPTLPRNYVRVVLTGHLRVRNVKPRCEARAYESPLLTRFVLRAQHQP